MKATKRYTCQDNKRQKKQYALHAKLGKTEDDKKMHKSRQQKPKDTYVLYKS